MVKEKEIKTIVPQDVFQIFTSLRGVRYSLPDTSGDDEAVS
jgi:hypothetical protein